MRAVRCFALTACAVLIACSDSSSPTGLQPVRSQSACLERAVFDDPAASPYCLPFAAGETYTLTQSYCSQAGWSHHTRFAYDFDLPMGTEVLAARAGEVVELREHHSDSDRNGGHENVVILRHADDTLGLYIHMMEQGILVEMGEQVPRGTLIGWSGASGDTNGYAHLHFQVCLRPGKCSTGTSEITLPVNFRNAEGTHTAGGGLLQGANYTALPCS